MSMKYVKTITHTLYDEEEHLTCAWDEGQSWARFSSSEFQFTVSRDAVEDLRLLCDAFLQNRGDKQP